MKYEGQLYARVAGRYVPTEATAKDVDALKVCLTTAEKLLRGVRDFAPAEYQSTIDTFIRIV